MRKLSLEQCSKISHRVRLVFILSILVLNLQAVRRFRGCPLDHVAFLTSRRNYLHFSHSRQLFIRDSSAQQELYCS